MRNAPAPTPPVDGGDGLQAGLESTYLELVRHSAVYGLGLVLVRIASFALLPVYTRYLPPADYGVMALLDVMATFFVSVFGTAFVAGVGRHHFDPQPEAERKALWWTGTVCLLLVSTAIILPAAIFREPLGRLALGPDEENATGYVSLMLATVWLSLLGQLPDAYLRVRKWSGTFVTLSSLRLALNIILNLYFLIVLELGLVGVLIGNLLSTLATTLTLSSIMLWNLGPFRLRWSIVPPILRFSGPLLLAALVSLVLHDADRYLLRALAGVEQVGIYSLAYLFGQGITGMVVGPFASIWNVALYEIAPRADAKRVFGAVFLYFVYAFCLVMFGVSLVADALIRVMAAPHYAAAGGLVPIICLAYTFFAINEHFRTPVTLSKRTSLMIPVFLGAAALNIAGNLLLIPRFGPHGAAWATVVSFAAFSFGGLAWYRRHLERFEYPLARFWLVVGGMTLSYLGHRWLVSFGIGTLGELGSAAAIWLVWAVVLLQPIYARARTFISEGRIFSRLESS